MKITVTIESVEQLTDAVEAMHKGRHDYNGGRKLHHCPNSQHHNRTLYYIGYASAAHELDDQATLHKMIGCIDAD